MNKKNNNRVNLSSEEKRALLTQLLQEEKSKPHTFPLSFAQERLWFLNQLDPESVAYNLGRAIRLRGYLNVKALQQAFEAIVTRHESLRTTFNSVDGNPVQVIARDRAVAMPVIDLMGRSQVNQEEEIQRLAIEAFRQPFDLAQGPLMRTKLLRLGEEAHVLLLTMHHIIADDWSHGVLFQELSALYRAFTTGQPLSLPALPIQYADFAVWQRQWLQGHIAETQLSYWKKQLRGAPAMHELPTDRPRPTIQTFSGARKSLVLSTSLTEKLRTLGQRAGFSMFMTLLTAFNILLSRYSGQKDIVVGTPIAGRNRAELEGLIGFFLNTLVLRSDLSESSTFWDLLQRVRDTCLGAYAHQDYPFEKLVKDLRPERHLNHNPLFQIMFVFHNALLHNLDLPGLQCNPMWVDSGQAIFDLTLYAFDEPEGLNLIFEYNTDLFDESTIQRMMRHYLVLLEGIVVNPESPISQLPLLTETEQQLLVKWNETAVNYPQDQCIHQLFEAQVELTPETSAIVFESQQMSFAELNERANQLAHYLRKWGVGPKVMVGVCMERSLEMVIGVLGVLKTGGAYVPLDPAYPKERLNFMLEDSQVPVILTQQRFAEMLPEKKTHIICLDSDNAAIAQESKENLITEVTPHNTAYVIYTSGSTGMPKGVLGLHRGAVNRLNWMWETYPLKADDICCQKTTLSFVDSVWEIFGPLLKGVQTIIISDETLKDPHQLVQTLAANQVTRIVLVPSLLRVILEAYDDLQSRLARLKIWVTSGEALSIELCQYFWERMPDSILINLYGSSEVSADSTCYDTSKGKLPDCVPIGRPIANTQVYILDPHLQPVPIGVPGELHIGGVGLARGYLNRPELTNEKFIQNPFCDDPQARLYKTGDLARYLPDGNIEFLGRLDHQVKIRGFRIELAEIETVLTQHPAVHETVVVAHEDAVSGKRLIAYIVSKHNNPPTHSELRRFLRKKLPEYMIPATFMMLDTLPLTPNGKVDRRALPVPDQTRPDLEYDSVSPRTPTEGALTRIWAEILGLEQVGVYDNFFELGGHSLLASQVIFQVRDVFGVKLPLRKLFETPTIAELARVIEKPNNNDTDHVNDQNKEDNLQDARRKLGIF